jgi:SAM-dependent methyltransferase
MSGQRPTIEGLKKVLDAIADDSRIPANFVAWIRDSLRYGGRKIRILRYIQEHTPKNQMPRLLDVGAQFGALAIYETQLGCRAAALDYGMYAKAFREAVADHGVDYRECDLESEPLPFADDSFDIATYTDVIEHHAFSPKRVLTEIHRVLVPGGRLILATPNHTSIYNRIKLFFGSGVSDEFDYFFNTTAGAKTYPGHHREFTRAEIRSALEPTNFRALECRVIDDDLASLLNDRQCVGSTESISGSPDFVIRFLGHFLVDAAHAIRTLDLGSRREEVREIGRFIPPVLGRIGPVGSPHLKSGIFFLHLFFDAADAYAAEYPCEVVRALLGATADPNT